ncbi:MAG: DUF167 domain-containing protein [Dehalococcoidales bacterium]|jgi:uncharacterized protein (TIGR00251 family)
MDIRRDKAILAVRVTPGAKRNAITALKEGVWNIKIAAPPVEGRANEELVAFLSKKLDIRRSSLNVIKGQSSRNKLVSVSGMSQKEIARRLSAELDS